MSKELDKAFESLSIIIETLSNDKGRVMCRKELNVLVQTLQRLKQIENINPSEALECFKDIEERCKNDYEECIVGYDYEKELSTIKQALTTKSKKELFSDIITNKLINYRKFHSDFIMSNISYDKYVEYWTSYGCEQLTEQEFIFLKEMSNNE